MLLEVDDLNVFYGRIQAIKGISITVDEGEIVTLIGANGAGKTTTMKTISGVRPVARAASCSTAATSPGCPPTSGSSSASARRPKGGASSRA